LNLARPLARAGWFVGLALLTGTVVDGVVRGGDWRAGLAWGAAFVVVGAVLLATTGALGNWIFLRGRMRDEIARGNVAAGLVAAGHFVAVGWILGGCFEGRGFDDLTISATFYLIGVATLLGLQLCYRALTRYADDQEVLGENSAAAVGFVGITLALAIIVAHAAEGAFLGWATSLRGYGKALLLAVALFPVRQLVVGPLLLRLPAGRRKGALDRLVAEERNVIVGAIEALAYVTMAILATGIG
jgi:uncharacterized membrane protein YjfL (UPF0719 family)